MTYQQAIEKSFTTKWKVGTCSQGEQCWCRTIKPVEPILYKDGDSDDSYYIVRSGEMLKETAEYFVKLHNETFNTKEKQSANFEREGHLTLHWDSLPTPNEINKRMKKRNENNK